MHLGAFSTLLILALLVVGAPAKQKKPPAPEIGTQLNAANFDVTVKQDFWFVEYFSPSCPHCKQFAPTWEEFINARHGIAGLGFAQVNCLANGDLCNTHKVKGYPELNLFFNGEKFDEYKDERLQDKMNDWLVVQMDRLKAGAGAALKAKFPTGPAPAPPAAQVVAEKPAPPPPPPPPPVQPDEPAPPRKIVNPEGTVLSLDPTSFPGAVAQGPIFVKFFAPWCGHCKKLAPDWERLGRRMKDALVVAEVNCDKHKGLCKSEGIQGYPQLFLYINGKKTEYAGARKFDKLEDFAVKAAAPALEPISHSAFKSALLERDIFFVYAHSASDTSLTHTIEEGAKYLVGGPSIFSTTDTAVPRTFNLEPPSLISVKDGKLSSYLPLSHVTPSEVGAWLDRHRLPLFTELGPDNFGSVMDAPSKPVVVLAVLSPADAHGQALHQAAARAWRDRGRAPTREVVFAWMDGEKWASWLKSMYGVKPPLPRVVIVDHSKLVYYDAGEYGAAIDIGRTESVTVALDAALRGVARVKYSENIIERGMRGLSNRLDAGMTAVRENVLLSLVVLGAVIVVAGASFRRCMRAEQFSRGIYIPRGAERLD